VSLWQLEEAGCDIMLFDGHGRLKVFDPEYNLLISAPCTGNRLYTVKLGVVPPICLLTKLNDVAWQWHARYGHLNFRALRDLGRKKWWKVFQWWIVWSKFVMVALWGNNTARHFQRYPLTELKRA
jgi:hypothetical protein